MESTGSETPALESNGDADAAADAGVADIARHTASYLKAWGRLVSSEAAVAKANLALLVIGALLVPALAFAAVVALDALLATLLFELVKRWWGAVLGVLLLDAGALLYVLWLLRAWWRTLSLPHSRQALTRLWRSHDQASQERQSTPARSAA